MIPTAVIGVGQTHHKSRRRDVSLGGLVREAVFRALETNSIARSLASPRLLAVTPTLCSS